jgi:hypothetical protein
MNKYSVLEFLDHKKLCSLQTMDAPVMVHILAEKSHLE